MIPVLISRVTKWGLLLEPWLSLRKALMQVSYKLKECILFMEYHFYLKELINYGYSVLCIRQTFS